MMIYSVTLSKDKNENEFERFMLDDVFPAVDKRSRRDGQISSLVLLKGNNTDHTNEYLWFVEGGVNGGAARQQVDRIEAYGAVVVPMLDFVEIGRWPAEE